jgi:hypothetical protein
MAEDPTLAQEEPKTEPKPKVDKESIDVDSFLKTMEEFGVNNLEDLSGKLDASTRYGQMANQLGDERAKVQSLEQRLQQLETRPVQPQQNLSLDDAMDYGAGTVNIEDVMGRVIDKKLDAREQRAIEQQKRASKAYIEAHNRIVNDKNFKHVKDIWDNKMADPNFQFQVSQGIINPVEAYRDMVDEFKDGLILKGYETVKQLKEGSTGVTPPHLEAGETPSQGNLVSTEEEADPGKKIINEKRKKLEESIGKSPQGGTLTHEDELDVIDSIGIFAPGTPQE